MAVKTVKTYTCDGCGKTAGKPSDVTRVRILIGKENRYSRAERNGRGDLCAKCLVGIEDALVEAGILEDIEE